MKSFFCVRGEVFFFLLTLIFFSCGNGYTGRSYIVNETDSDINILIQYEKSSEFYTLEKRDTVYPKLSNVNISVKVVKNALEIDAINNKYYVARYDYATIIHETKKYDFLVVNEISDSIFTSGSDTLYFYEQDGKTSEWSDTASKIKIDSSVKAFTVSCYTQNPKFVLASESGGGKCNGYSVAAQIKNGVVYLY